MANPFVHVELNTPDLPGAKDFYGKLFGWQFEVKPMPGGDGVYTLIEVGGGTGGGMWSSPDPDTEPGWMAYVGVDDIRASTAKARELGATILVDGMAVGDAGWMSIFVDPSGAKLAMWQGRDAAA